MDPLSLLTYGPLWLFIACVGLVAVGYIGTRHEPQDEPRDDLDPERQLQAALMRWRPR